MKPYIKALENPSVRLRGIYKRAGIQEDLARMRELSAKMRGIDPKKEPKKVDAMYTADAHMKSWDERNGYKSGGNNDPMLERKRERELAALSMGGKLDPHQPKDTPVEQRRREVEAKMRADERAGKIVNPLEHDYYIQHGAPASPQEARVHNDWRAQQIKDIRSGTLDPYNPEHQKQFGQVGSLTQDEAYAYVPVRKDKVQGIEIANNGTTRYYTDRQPTPTSNDFMMNVATGKIRHATQQEVQQLQQNTANRQKEEEARKNFAANYGGILPAVPPAPQRTASNAPVTESADQPAVTPQNTADAKPQPQPMPPVNNAANQAVAKPVVPAPATSNALAGSSPYRQTQQNMYVQPHMPAQWQNPQNQFAAQQLPQQNTDTNYSQWLKTASFKKQECYDRALNSRARQSNMAKRAGFWSWLKSAVTYRPTDWTNQEDVAAKPFNDYHRIRRETDAKRQAEATTQQTAPQGVQPQEKQPLSPQAASTAGGAAGMIGQLIPYAVSAMTNKQRSYDWSRYLPDPHRVPVANPGTPAAGYHPAASAPEDLYRQVNVSDRTRAQRITGGYNVYGNSNLAGMAPAPKTGMQE